MLLIAVCDDLQADALQIKNYIKDFCKNKDHEINIITFSDGESLVKHYIYGKSAFDIIFLDIYMNGKNGIMTAKQLRKYDSECKIIFTTSSTEHALESFEVFPFNYLIKPISKIVFDSIFDKALEVFESEMQNSFSFKTGYQIQTISYKNILYAESNAKFVSIHTTQNKTYSVTSKLDDIQKQINDKRFIRCHKSYLLNMDYISGIEGYSFKLFDNNQIPITQRNFAIIKKEFFDYKLEKVGYS